MRLSGGDARKLLNILELVVLSESSDTVTLTNDMVFKKVQNNTVLYDKTVNSTMTSYLHLLNRLEEVIQMQLFIGWQGWLKVAKI